MISHVLVAFLVAWYLIEKWSKRHFVRVAELLKSSLICLPLIGHAHVFIGNAEAKMKALQKLSKDAMQGGGTVAHWYAHKLYITIVDPVVADIILKNCLEKDDLMKYFQELTGEGSIFTSGRDVYFLGHETDAYDSVEASWLKKWRPQRKLLAPSFSMKNLNRFVEVFETQSSILTDKIEKFAGQESSPMWKFLSAYTMDAVCETTMGVQAKAQESEHPNLIALDSMFHTLAVRFTNLLLHNDFVFKKTSAHRNFTKNKTLVNKFINDVISEKRIKYANQNSGSMDNNADRVKPFVELVLESAGDETDTAIRDECVVLLAAGTDTSAVSVGFALLALAAHPDVQEKAYQELREIFGDPERPVQADDLHRLKYLDAVCRETLRLYSPVPSILRKIEKDIELPSGVVLPAGCGAFISIWGIHHNPAVWGKDVEEFRPERFLDSTPRHPAAFIPFSYGPRNCAGYQYAMMSMKTVLCNILRKFRLVPASKNSEPLRLALDIMLRDVNQYRVGIEKRQ